MSAYELWVCDWHADPPESDDDFVNEDTATDRGWVRIERYVNRPSALGGGKTWRHQEVKHVCPDCLKEPECRAWITDSGFTGYYIDDVERLAALEVA